MSKWTFCDYCSEAGNNLIQKWYGRLSPQARADFDVTVKGLSTEPDWKELKEFKMLKGKYSGLGEIRFNTNNVQYRAIGYFGPGRLTFSILVGCYKKQGVYKPPNAFDLALKRKRLLDQRRAYLYEREIT